MASIRHATCQRDDRVDDPKTENYIYTLKQGRTRSIEAPEARASSKKGGKNSALFLKS